MLSFLKAMTTKLHDLTFFYQVSILPDDMPAACLGRGAVEGIAVKGLAVIQQDFDHLQPDVELKGAARQMLKGSSEVAK